MPIPFVDLQKQFSVLENDIRKAINRVLDHAQFIMGPEVGQLEKELSAFTGARHAIGCSSGTDALLIPLMAWGVGPGDAVFTTPFTFIATAEVISFLGATPVFVDIDPVTFNLDPDKLKETVERVERQGVLNPRGIIPVDLFGLPADYDPISALAEEHGLFVLADAAQGFGATYHGRTAGTLGHVTATSFFPAKPLGCYGDGGAIFTDDDKMADKIRSIVVHGKGEDKYQNIRIGLNGRLDTLQAAILLVKLAAFPGELKARQRAADHYTDKLSRYVETPRTPEGLTSAWAQYSILSGRREAILASLKEAGAPTAIYYPIPLHLQAAYAGLGHKEGDFPLAEAASKRIFSIPMHPYLEPAQLEVITGSIIKAVS